jgi:NitT/TauT family transport system substrate-binding protein/sulfonate transport system substrate-binding protein
VLLNTACSSSPTLSGLSSQSLSQPVQKTNTQVEGTKNFLVSQKLAKSDFKITDWIITQK